MSLVTTLCVCVCVSSWWPDHRIEQGVHPGWRCLPLVLTPSVSATSTLPLASSSICLWMLRIASKLMTAFSFLHSGSSIRQKSGGQSGQWVTLPRQKATLECLLLIIIKGTCEITHWLKFFLSYKVLFSSIICWYKWMSSKTMLILRLDHDAIVPRSAMAFDLLCLFKRKKKSHNTKCWAGLPQLSFQMSDQCQKSEQCIFFRMTDDCITE